MTLLSYNRILPGPLGCVTQTEDGSKDSEILAALAIRPCNSSDSQLFKIVPFTDPATTSTVISTIATASASIPSHIHV